MDQLLRQVLFYINLILDFDSVPADFRKKIDESIEDVVNHKIPSSLDYAIHD